MSVMSIENPTHKQTYQFSLLPLGLMGAEEEGNCTSILLNIPEDEHCIALDAGSIVSGLKEALQHGSLESWRMTGESDNALIGRILKDKIATYLISHAHLDHIAGLVLHSDLDTEKVIMGIDSTIDNLRDHIFNWKIWPNFCDEGVEPLLKQYHYERISLEQWLPIPNSSLSVKTYLLNHYEGYPSSAFLLGKNNHYILFLGDTGSDQLQGCDNLGHLWRSVAPLAADGSLKAVLMEVTFANQRPDDQLFGHLTPRLAFAELERLISLSYMMGNDFEPSQLNFIPIHFKPGFRSDIEPTPPH